MLVQLHCSITNLLNHPNFTQNERHPASRYCLEVIITTITLVKEPEWHIKNAFLNDYHVLLQNIHEKREPNSLPQSSTFGAFVFSCSSTFCLLSVFGVGYSPLNHVILL